MSRLTEYSFALFVNPFDQDYSSGGGGSTTKLSDRFSVVQGADGKYYIIDTATGQVVGNGYTNSSQATYARDNGKLNGDTFTPATVPESLASPAASEYSVRSFGSKQWAVVDANGNRVSDWYTTGDAAKADLASGAFKASNVIQPPSFDTTAGGEFYQGAGTYQGATGEIVPSVVKALKEGTISPQTAMNTLIGRLGLSPDGALQRLVTEGVLSPTSTLDGLAQLGQTAAPQQPAQQQAPAQNVSTQTAAMPSGLSDLQQYAWNVAQRYGIPPNDFLGLIGGESSWDPGAYNAKSGAAGLGQFLPSTAAGFGVTGPELMADPYKALDLAGQLVVQNAQAVGGDMAKAFAAYFVGAQNVLDAVAQGGDNWLAVIDPMVAEKYGQGTVSDFFRSHNITESLGGANASGAVGPDGRTFGEITGTPYLSDAERDWYRNIVNGGTPVDYGGQAQGGLQSASGATQEQLTRKEQNLADFRAGKIDEATYNARNDAIDAEIKAASKARATASAAAEYDRQQAQQKQALDAYAANLTAQGFKVFHNPDGTPSFYYDAQGRPVSINYVPERGRVEAGTPGDVNQSELLRALNEGATYSNPNGQGSAAMQAYLANVQDLNGPLPTPTSRNTSLGSVTPEAAAAYLLSGTNGSGLAGVSGSVMKGLGLDSAPTFEQLLGYLGTSLPGSGSTIEGNAALPKNIGDEYARRYQDAIDQGKTPEEANYIAQTAVAVTKGATGLLQQQYQQQAADLNARLLQNGTGSGSPTSTNPNPVKDVFSVGPNGVKNQLGQYVDQAGNVDGVDSYAPSPDLLQSSRVEQRADGFYVWIGGRWVGPYRSWNEANQAGGGSGQAPNGNTSVNQQLAGNALRPAAPRTGIDQAPRSDNGPVPVRPPVVTPPPVDTPPPVVVPPNYGGGPVIYQPATVQAPTAPLSTIVSNFAANPSVINSVNTAPPSKPLDVAGSVSQIISDQEKRRKRNPFTVAAAPNPFARVA